MPTLRECLLSSIAQYDDAPSIADRKEAAVVVVERARMYLAAEDQTPRKLKRLGGEDDDELYSNPQHV